MDVRIYGMFCASIVAELMRSIDHDPKVCEKLPHLLSRNGFTPVEEVSKSIPLSKTYTKTKRV
jgi:hypothetical protein